jgi:hypothetical protein
LIIHLFHLLTFLPISSKLLLYFSYLNITISNFFYFQIPFHPILKNLYILIHFHNILFINTSYFHPIQNYFLHNPHSKNLQIHSTFLLINNIILTYFINYSPISKFFNSPSLNFHPFLNSLFSLLISKM